MTSATRGNVPGGDPASSHPSASRASAPETRTTPTATGTTATATGTTAPTVGRLAPSPTGLLHLGHARTFLIAWWSARSQGGQIVLRIEDLDGARAEQKFIDTALHDLEWLGLDWDGPPLIQSSGLPRLNDAIDHLVQRRLAYPCTCTRGDVRNAQSAPQQGVAEPRYPGTCRDRYTSIAQAEATSGRPAGLRLRVPNGPITFDDRIAGPQSFDVQAQVGDFLIARRGGAPAYQLAVVVDDAFQHVTEIVRGDDLLPSTARQILLQRALALPHPTWSHLPLVLDSNGRRLAKREAALGLSDLRARGVDPRAIVTFAAQTSGIHISDLVTPAQALPAFNLDTIPRTPISLSPENAPFLAFLTQR
ncbi:MAG: tRNA glutamyl-Q(34) synthetase GluQRS [Myxococcota bacterium]